MIRKIRKKINKYLSLLQVGDKKINAIRNISEDNYALQLLLNMFENRSFLSLTSWSISTKEVLHICNDIVINNRKNIVEFGSGFSTICIAQLIKKEKLDVNFFSVEDNQEWITILKRKLTELDIEKYVKFVHAPIVEVDSEIKMKNQLKWYDTNVLSNVFYNEKFDCIIVDGPPSKFSPYIRFSTIPFLKNNLDVNYSIFLDDYRRNIEKEIMNEWLNILKCEYYDFDRYAYLTNKQYFETEPITNFLF